MNNHKIYFTNAAVHFASVSLISVYDSHIYGKHYNPFVSAENDAEMYCMLFTLDGSAKIVLCDGTEHALQKNSVFFGQASTIKYMESDCEHWHQLAYWFATQNVSLPLDRVFPLKDIDAEAESDFTDRVILLMQTQQENNLNLANALCAEKLFSVLGKVDYLQRKHNEKIDAIISYVNSNIEKPLTVKDIAATFHYCEKHINHIFKVAMNVTPKQFVNDTKLDNVRFLLTTTSLTLQTLAEKYSFSSSSHLTNSFKKKFGCTPSEYRQNHGVL